MGFHPSGWQFRFTLGFALMGLVSPAALAQNLARPGRPVGAPLVNPVPAFAGIGGGLPNAPRVTAPPGPMGGFGGGMPVGQGVVFNNPFAGGMVAPQLFNPFAPNPMMNGGNVGMLPNGVPLPISRTGAGAAFSNRLNITAVNNAALDAFAMSNPFGMAGGAFQNPFVMGAFPFNGFFPPGPMLPFPWQGVNPLTFGGLSSPFAPASFPFASFNSPFTAAGLPFAFGGVPFAGFNQPFGGAAGIGLPFALGGGF
ncbi:MAG: hypothetical protein ACK4RK_12550 [Gemmataceae bacterium]